MDTVDKTTRSFIMSRVGQKNTGPETLLRSSIHAAGLRYRLHDKMLPGSPDLVFPRFRAVAFVHGCYWHSHGCYRSTVPKTSHEFWSKKFQTNRSRDKRNESLLLKNGWRVLIVWECALSGKTAKSSSAVAKVVKAWLESSDKLGDIAGMPIVAARRRDREARDDDTRA